ncbi:transmembrane protein 212-like [Alosa pseudoharengus]|uniref:transmembrane protein 212-like n=1 Tax=Alosa pseudoharengus TaxID=34774 RepID=UPI003F8955B3
MVVCQVSGCQLGFGITSVLSGILAFFPMGTYNPWYLGWSTKIAAPVWVGVLWELSYVFSILCGLTAPLQFAIAVAGIVLGPYCYYSFHGAVGTGYLAHAVRLPYPYLAFPGLCLDPRHVEWFHLVLHTADLITSLAIFTLSLFLIVILTLRVLHFGHVNRQSHGR